MARRDRAAAGAHRSTTRCTADPTASWPAEPAPDEAAVQLRYVPSAGVEAGHWWGELTVDQRGADAFSLIFDTAPLAADTGDPRLSAGGDPRQQRRLAAALVRQALRRGTRRHRHAGDRRRPAGRPGLAAGRRPGVTGRALLLDLHVTSWVFPPRPQGPALPVERHVADDLAHAAPGTRDSPARPGRHPAGPAGRPASSPGRAGSSATPGPAQRPDGVSGWGDMLPVRWNLQRDDDRRGRPPGGAAPRAASFDWGRVVDEEYLRYEVSDADPAHAVGARRGQDRDPPGRPAAALSAQSSTWTPT